MKKTKSHIGPVTETVLKVIAVAGVVTIAVCAPNALQLLRPFLKGKKYSPKQAIERNIESLVRTGHVRKFLNKKGEIALELTRKGKWESSLRGMFQRPKRWDGKWRVVIFDVPNTQSDLRRELTRGMKLYGFKLLQKSVWIYPHACDDFVDVLRDHLKLTDNVVYLTVSTMEDEKKWKSIFKV